MQGDDLHPVTIHDGCHFVMGNASGSNLYSHCVTVLQNPCKGFVNCFTTVFNSFLKPIQ
jgi:hypothetical protein